MEVTGVKVQESLRPKSSSYNIENVLLWTKEVTMHFDSELRDVNKDALLFSYRRLS